MNAPKLDTMSVVNARLLSERELAGDLLDGRISPDELAIAIKERKLIAYNVVIYLMELAGAQPQLNPGFTLPVQRESIEKLAEMLCHRALRVDAGDYIFLQVRNRHTKWLSHAMELIARHRPEGIIYLLDRKTKPYITHDAQDRGVFSTMCDDLSSGAKGLVAQSAKVKRKLPALFRITGWEECKEHMKSNRDKRIVLSIEMGL
jgi:hypothetical protein